MDLIVALVVVALIVVSAKLAMEATGILPKTKGGDPNRDWPCPWCSNKPEKKLLTGWNALRAQAERLGTPPSPPTPEPKPAEPKLPKLDPQHPQVQKTKRKTKPKTAPKKKAPRKAE